MAHGSGQDMKGVNHQAEEEWLQRTQQFATCYCFHFVLLIPDIHNYDTQAINESKNGTESPDTH